MVVSRRFGWFFSLVAAFVSPVVWASEARVRSDKPETDTPAKKALQPLDVSIDATTALWISSVTAFKPTPTPFPSRLFATAPANGLMGDRAFFATRADGSGLLFLSPLSPLRAVLRVAAAEARASLTTTVAAAETEAQDATEASNTEAMSASDRRSAVLRHRRRSVLNERTRDAVRDGDAAPEAQSYDIAGLSAAFELLSLPGASTTTSNSGDRIPDGSGAVSLRGHLTDALSFTVTGLAVESASNLWRAGAEFDLELEGHAVSLGAAYGRRFQSNAESQKNQGDNRGLGALHLRHDGEFGRGVSGSWGARLTRADYVKSGARIDPEIALVVALGEFVGRPAADDGPTTYVRLGTSADSLFPGQETLAGDGASIAFTEGLALFARDIEAQRTWRSEAAVGRTSPRDEWRLEAGVRRDTVDHALLVSPSALAGAPLVRNLGRPSSLEAIALVERTFADAQAQASIEYAYGRFAEMRSPFDPRSYHRITARMDAYLRRTGTALVLFHRTHEGAPVAWRGFGSERVRHHRYLVEVRQDLPWVPRFVGADMAVLVGVRNVYYDDVERRTLDEFAVLGPARRLTGGIRVQF